VTDVRLHGSRSSQHPESRNTSCVLTRWNPGFSHSYPGVVARRENRGGAGRGGRGLLPRLGLESRACAGCDGGRAARDAGALWDESPCFSLGAGVVT